ncbi:MAG: hypothetical protein M3495_20025 [Pseudomonadota bacterium]|nr:hypothetical protein [Gammaproteobacteria bacterium]MDQ3583745.1 hypothetical protein [Pseudomonadota bacterium]
MSALANTLRFNASTLWVDLTRRTASEDSEVALDELAAFLRGPCQDNGIRPFRPGYADVRTAADGHVERARLAIDR